MSPLSEAIKTELVYVRNNGQHVYKTNGSLDSEWTVGNVPHGGYIATIILSTLLLHQSITKSSHPDIAHLTIQFPSPSIIAPLFLEIITTSISKRWSRLELRSLQYISGLPIVRCTASAIFTTLPELTMATLPTPTEFTLMPHTPSPFARIIPLLSHPSESKARESIGIFNFRKRMNWTRGAKDVRWSNDDKEKTSLDWAGWVQLTDEQEDLRTSSALIGFFTDIFSNGIEYLPKSQQPGPSWLPTLVLTIDFKSKFPLSSTPLTSTTSQPIAARTVGTYNRTDFISKGRYGATTEIWTAPGELGASRPVGESGEEWRKGMQILAVATQMALIVPFELNSRKATNASASAGQGKVEKL